MVFLVRTRVTNIENNTIFKELKDHKLRQFRSAGAGVMLDLLPTTIAAEAVILKILSAKRSESTHMDKGIGIVFSSGIHSRQIFVQRHALLVHMEHSTGGIVTEARAFAVYMTIQIESILMTLENTVEQLAVAIDHRLTQLAILEIVIGRQMANHKNGQTIILKRLCPALHSIG